MAAVPVKRSIASDVFLVMFAKTSLLLCCSCIRLFVANYVCVVPYGVMRIFDAIIRVSNYGLHNPAGSLENSTVMV